MAYFIRVMLPNFSLTFGIQIPLILSKAKPLEFSQKDTQKVDVQEFAKDSLKIVRQCSIGFCFFVSPPPGYQCVFAHWCMFQNCQIPAPPSSPPPPNLLDVRPRTEDLSGFCRNMLNDHLIRTSQKAASSGWLSFSCFANMQKKCRRSTSKLKLMVKKRRTRASRLGKARPRPHTCTDRSPPLSSFPFPYLHM